MRTNQGNDKLKSTINFSVTEKENDLIRSPNMFERIATKEVDFDERSSFKSKEFMLNFDPTQVLKSKSPRIDIPAYSFCFK